MNSAGFELAIGADIHGTHAQHKGKNFFFVCMCACAHVSVCVCMFFFFLAVAWESDTVGVGTPFDVKSFPKFLLDF